MDMAKTWLITGVGSGLGKATAEAALARGDAVAGIVRKPDAAKAFEAIAPGRARAFLADVSDRDAVFAAVDQTWNAFDGIDIVVNNAGQVLESYVEEAKPDEIRALFEVNLIGPLSVIQAVLPYFRRRRQGRIANFSSGGGILGVPVVGLYSASKFALEGVSEALAQEVGPLGIHVTIVEPGAFRTNLLVTGRTTVETAIEDYEAGAGAFRRMLAEMGGNEPGDPAKLAQAMLKLADTDSPPLRLALGDDAIQMALAKAESIRSDVAAWSAVGTRLAFAD
jgi:NAD(P)-dependent dehydrogenase (short-subunit alcohol dehydrogenase family)